MNLKRITGLTLCMALLLTGCGSNKSSKLQTTNSVDKVLEEQINADTETTGIDSDGITDEDENSTIPLTGNTLNDEDADTINVASENADSSVDIDLTVMNSDMVYSTVYQFMVDPDSYIGKTVKMEGQYYATWYEPTSQYYHYVIIADAAACCSQGLEFIWEDGSHIYPDDYPADDTNVCVTGTFETYYETEDGTEYLYCRLSNATMEVLD